MASFVQWRRLFEKGELKHMYFLYGSERLLVEEIVNAIRDRVDPSDFDYATLSAERVPPRDVWAAINQYPVDPQFGKRLVVVREAEAITSWTQFESWATPRSMPQVYAVFVSSEIQVNTALPHFKRFVTSGRLVRCSKLADPDAIEYVTRLGRIDTSVAEQLLARVGWDLGEAVNAMAKLAFFDVDITEKMVTSLTEPSSVDSFVDQLIGMHKAQALFALRQMGLDEYSRALGLLNSRLEQLGKVNRGIRRGMTTGGMVRELRLSRYVVEQLERSSRFYDRQRVLECVRALAFVDSRLQQGERDGVMEALCAVW